MKTLTFDQAFPRARLAATQEHMMDVWRGDARRVYACIPAMDYSMLDDPARQAESAARIILRGGQYPGYNMPRLTADYGKYSVASYWGGRRYRAADGSLTIDPVARNADEADALRDPDPPSSGDAARAAKLYLDVCDILRIEPFDKLWTTTIDFRGPLDAAATLWEPNDFLAAMTKRPEAVHRFLDRVTDHLIALMEFSIAAAKNRVCGGVQPDIWLPSDLGVVMTEEFMSRLTPEEYAEFGIPYTLRIGGRFGGLFLRCGGAFARHLPGLRDCGVNLMGVEYTHPYTTLADIYDVFEDSIVIVPKMGIKARDEYASKAAFIGDLARGAPAEARLWFALHPEDRDFMIQMAIVQAHITSYRL